MSGMRATVIACASIAVLLTSSWSSAARADARVTTLEGVEWSDVVTSLETNLRSEGHALLLCARDAEGACLPCDEYTLAFDEPGTRAFRVGRCDRATGATHVRLVDRSALFDHDYAVPMPRDIQAQVNLANTADDVRPAPDDTDRVGCFAHVAAVMRDEEHGVDVRLVPEAYELRPSRRDVAVTSDGERFELSADAVADPELDYEIAERVSGAVVLRGHTTLACTRPPSLGDALAATTVEPPPPPPEHEPDAQIPTPHGMAPRLYGTVGSEAYASGVGSCPGAFPLAPQHVLGLAAHVDRLVVSVRADRTLALAVRTPDGAWHCGEPDAAPATSVSASVDAAVAGRIEVWIGHAEGDAGTDYELDVDSLAQRQVTNQTPNFAAFGVSMGVAAAGWLGATLADVGYQGCASSACPDQTFRDLAWIPFVGPWIAMAEGSRGNTADLLWAMSAMTQDVSLLFGVMGLLIGHTVHETRFALGTDPAAPTLGLALAPSTSGGMIEATLRF